MKRTPTSPINRRSDRRRVEAYCQLLVDAGVARWSVNDDGDTQLHLESGEAYLFSERGLIRLHDRMRGTPPDIEFNQ